MVVENTFKRAIDHLANSVSSDDVLGALQAVEDLFTAEWLSVQDGHRLQTLWLRKDFLSTSELFVLGKAIVKLSVDNFTWLKATASEIKKNRETAHGLITEIIMIGSLSIKNGSIKPCPKSFPIYDYTIDYVSGYKYKVSVKNFDISIHERAFEGKCNIIRTAFLNFLNAKKTTGYLRVNMPERLLTHELTLEICCTIVFQLKAYGSYFTPKSGVNIIFCNIGLCGASDLAQPSKTVPSSDIVMILAKQHHNENRNIESKIQKANENMLKDPIDKTSLKQLVIRLGETTDSSRIAKFLKKIADDYERCGFDMCLLFQPLVVSDPKHQSTNIVNTIHVICKSRSIEDPSKKLSNMGVITIDLGVGSVLTEEIPKVLVNKDTNDTFDTSGAYVYQKGDIYLNMKKNGKTYSAELSQLAPGIVTHAVHDGVQINSVVYSESDKLLII